MGGGAVVTEDGDTPGRAYHFRQSWIHHKLKASPSQPDTRENPAACGGIHR
mgnify:CR=1 FL=1